MKKQILSTYCNEKLLGDCEAFFKGDKLITVIHGDDGNYRNEYMDCLFKAFGITVKPMKKLTKKQKEALKYDIELHNSNVHYKYDDYDDENWA